MMKEVGPGTAHDHQAAPFWRANQPGFRFSRFAPGTRDFFRDVEEHRYRLEPHIRELARFARWRDQDVLDAGCGIATDGVQFARAGARYTGLDFSGEALTLARRRFELEELDGTFVQGSVASLPFPDDSFDLVYSHGVIHHIPETETAVAEFERVLRPGGSALVMVYHRNSLNYYVNIMLVRRAFVCLLLLPRGARILSCLTGESPDLLAEHKSLLRRHGLRYLIDSSLFLSNNTDGPGNPLSKAYDRGRVVELFHGFDEVSTHVRFLNLRLYPAGERIASTPLARRLERRIGWHLYVDARRAEGR
jgi:ubiquinone/menaquinone biosynthesis C-methylase UbiE